MIITFYSYKGGVGRTQLVANIAAYLCYYKSKKVLLMEWDLEAPGLHFFFNKKNNDIDKVGLFGLLTEYVKLTRSKGNISTKELPVFSKEKHIVELAQSQRNTGRIDLIPASIYNSNYSETINDFNWYEFYEILQGKIYIEFLKKHLKSDFDYDYIFIDSRTGISDYSGICNIQLPDVNVLVVAPSIQNFEGSAKIAQNIINSSYVKQGFRKPTIFPILSRFDTSAKKEDVDNWITLFKSNFVFILKNIYKLPNELNGFQYDWILNNCQKENKKIFTKAYKEKSDKLYEKQEIPDSEFTILVDFFLSLNLFDDYMDSALLDYNKGIAFGENLLFEDNVNVNIKQISLAERYQNFADNYIEKVKENHEIGVFKAFNIKKINEFNVKNIYNLLNNCFDDSDFDGFVLMHFFDLYNSLSAGTSKSQKIMQLLDYSQRRGIFHELLELLEAINPQQYEKNKPYWR